MINEIRNSPLGQNEGVQQRDNNPGPNSTSKVMKAIIFLIAMANFSSHYIHHNLKALSSHRFKEWNHMIRGITGALCLVLDDFPELLATNIVALRFLAKKEKCLSNKDICENILGNSKHVVSSLFPALKRVWRNCSPGSRPWFLSRPTSPVFPPTYC